jgi:hypothetical protein
VFRCSLPLVLACLAAACGGDSPKTPDAAVKAWAREINQRDWQAACDLSVKPGSRCQRDLRTSFEGRRLMFEGPAVNGGGTKPGERYFSLDASDGGTVMVTAVPMGDGYAIRLEALFLPAGG